MERGAPRRLFAWQAACVAAFVCIAALPGYSDDTPGDLPPRLHLFLGFDGAEDSVFGHGGMVWAPLGDLHRSGWRMRAVGSGGTFEYLAGGQEITGRLTSAEVLAGFEWIGRDAGLTVYAGPVIQDQDTDPNDPGKPRQGTRFGAKARVEGWLRIADGVFANASGSYATAAETYSARLALTFAVSDRFALEPEFAAFGEPGYDQQRYGVLLQYRHTENLQVKLGGGWAIEPDADGPYVAAQIKMWR